jgi:hypothetical protein
MKIKSIKKIEYNGDVYNLRIKSVDGLNHNYIANNTNVSNCHKVKAKSIKTILENCKKNDYCFGLSGTVPKKGTLDRLTLMSHTGPLMSEITANFLQKNDYIAKCKAKIIHMDYIDEKTKDAFRSLARDRNTDGKKVFKLEQNYIIESESRRNFVCKLINKLNKNSLVLFHRREHGQAIYDQLRSDSNKQIYYIDGHTDKEIREVYKAKMENNGIQEYTYLDFDEYTVKLLSKEKALLKDGTYKIVGQLTEEDDIDDNFLKNYIV